MVLHRLSKLDFALVALAALLATFMLERSHRLDIQAPEAAEMMTASSCRDELENRRFVIRRMMIADGSMPTGNLWRSDTQLGSCEN